MKFVSKAVVMVLESKGDAASPAIIKLLQTFWKIGLITVDQMNRVGSCTCGGGGGDGIAAIVDFYSYIFFFFIQGFQRVYDELPEISLDVPHAHSMIENFVDLCHQESVITKQLRDACPSRSVCH